MTGGSNNRRCVASCMPSDIGSITVIGSEVFPLSLCFETDIGNPHCSVLVTAVWASSLHCRVCRLGVGADVA